MSDRNEYQRQYQSEQRAKAADVEIPECANKRRRKRYEKDTAKWLRYYLPGWFGKKFGPNQLEIISDLDYHIEHKATKCVAMDRGGGKTTIGNGCTLKGILTGNIHFLFIVAATGQKASEDFIKTLIMTLETNQRLIEDYPEVCVPFVKLQGKALRCSSQTVGGEKTFISITNGIVFPRVPGSRCSNAVIKAEGITSAQRGARHITADGEVIRPDFIFFDDAQTDESAKSELQTGRREEIVTSMMGMAGPGEKIGGYMACTVIEKGDLSSRFLDRKRHPEWYGTIYRMVNEWPATKDTLWEDYLDLRREDMENEDRKFKLSTEFYKEHFAEMNEGADVAWDGRKFDGDLTAIQSAFHLVLTVGGWHTFMAEYQNDPIEESSAQYNLTAEVVASRVNHRDRLYIPEETSIVTGFGDINHVGINYAIIAFKNDLTGYMVDYGKYPEGRAVLYDPATSNRTTEAQAITKAIYGFVRMINEKVYMQGTGSVKPDIIQIDGNYMSETVYNAVENAKLHIKPGFKLVVNRGRGYTQYKLPYKANKVIGQPGDHCHYERSDRETIKGIKDRHIIQDSDYWRMNAQKAFLLEPGVPGSLSIYGSKPRDHERLAREVAGEKLKNYAVTDKGPMYVYKLTPGQPNDLMDAITGCYAAASISGASLTGGEQSWRKRKKPPRRKPKVAIL